ncbi:YeeE/YedE family protein [Pantanalinema rosaneae CENA516]|uniref:YeeE/YedE family protein n=1 Tax=Pantanalinema rosaneae TaxID=1620701 RepID=UPI003D6FD64A
MDGISEPLTPINALPQRLRPQRLMVAIALCLLTAGAIVLSQYGWKHSLLFIIGGLFGVTLYYSSFGFASAYRKLLMQREVRGLYAQLLMLAIATILFAPILASQTVWGQSVRGAVAPVGMQGAIGALLFGIGMQLGGACGCGTLYTIGSGSLTMLLTLLTFCIGAFAASLTRQLWAGLPATSPIVLGHEIGWLPATIVQLVLFGIGFFLLRWWSRGKAESGRQAAAGLPEGTGQGIDRTLNPPSSALNSASNSQLFIPQPLRGSWSLVAGAITLAILNCFTLLLSGQPWRITWGFALWTAQIATWLGWNSTSSPFWSSEASQKVLSQGVLADVSSVMNIGIILGAVLAAAFVGRLIPKGQFTPALIGSTLLGGLIMGYGAFLAYGCNVSAFFGGIASTSVHGWIWIIFALLGTTIGIRLRPLFQ